MDRDAVVTEFFPVVQQIARKAARNLPNRFDLDDLVQWGMLGLLDALDTYDPARADFKAYAIPRIRGRIIDSARNADWIPRSAIRQRQQKQREIEELVANKTCEAAARLVDPRWTGPSVTQFGSISEEVNSELRRAVMHNTVTPETRAEEAEEQQAVVQALAMMPERERAVIVLHHYEHLMLTEIAHLFRISEFAVKRLHQKALAQLRSLLTEHGYGPAGATT